MQSRIMHLCFVLSFSLLAPGYALEPAAALATQPMWQAGKPVPVEVSYDVPAYGALDALAKLESASKVEAELAKKSGTSFVQSSTSQKSFDGARVEISLAPPVKPLPEISAAIGSLDEARAQLEAGKMSAVTAAFNAALKSAHGRIGAALAKEGSSLSFLQGVVSFKVNVLPGAAADSSVLSKITAIEGKRNDMESAMFGAAAAEFEGITDIIVAELKKQVSMVQTSNLRGAASFAQINLHNLDDANVKVVASADPYPTVASLVNDMETRRDISEGLARARILELDMKLIKAELAMAKKLLS